MHVTIPLQLSQSTMQQSNDAPAIPFHHATIKRWVHIFLSSLLFLLPSFFIFFLFFYFFSLFFYLNMNNNYRSHSLRKWKEDWTFSPGFEGGSRRKVKPKTAVNTYITIPHNPVKTSTQQRTNISPKLLKHHSTSRFHQQIVIDLSHL